MSIVNRLARLFRADVHAILDSLEEPETLIRQAMREMQEEIDLKEKALQDLVVRYEALTQDRDNRVARVAEGETQIRRCFDAGNEVLAKTILKKRLEQELRIKFIEGELAQLSKQQADLRTKLEEEKEGLKDISDKLNLLANKPTSSGNKASAFENVREVSEEDVEVAFLEARQRYVNQGV